MIGFSRGSRRYELRDRDQAKVFITRDVKFDKDGTPSLEDSQNACVEIDRQNDEQCETSSDTLDQVEE